MTGTATAGPAEASSGGGPAGMYLAGSDAVDDGDAARRAIYRRLRSAHATIAAGESARTLRLDTGRVPLLSEEPRPAGEPSAPPTPPARMPVRQATAAPTLRRATGGQTTAWLLASLGATVLGLGIGLGCWSLFGDRADLWNPAVAATLLGQGLLVIGLAQLVANLWAATRHAATRLAAMHDDVRRLRRLADEAAGRNTGSAAGFYADLTRDAPPERLLGNLRGQLDQLAARLR